MSWKETLRQQLIGNEKNLIEPSSPGEPVSSVLIPIGWNKETTRDEICLTKRALTVYTHKGQVSFPGGVRAVSDLDLKHTALRECEEEIGLTADHIDVLGMLKPVRTRLNWIIYPWVGYVNFPHPFTLNPIEVEKTIILPVDELLSRGLSQVQVKIESVTVHSIGIVAERELIWGATARMLEQLREIFVNLPRA